VSIAGFDPVDAFNLLLGRLDRIAVALEKIAKALEPKEVIPCQNENEPPPTSH